MHLGVDSFTQFSIADVYQIKNLPNKIFINKLITTWLIIHKHEIILHFYVS